MSKNNYITKAHLRTSEDIVLTINTYFKNKLLRPYLYEAEEDVIDWSKEPGVQWLGDYRTYEQTWPEVDILVFDDELHLTRAALKYPSLGNRHVKKQVWQKYATNTRKKLLRQYRASQSLANKDFSELMMFLIDPDAYNKIQNSDQYEKKSINGLLSSFRGLKLRKGGPVKVKNKLVNRPPDLISLPDKHKKTV